MCDVSEVAQRVDVFTWPADRTWPVLTSSLQVLLLNAHALLLVCCFIAAGRFASFAPDVKVTLLSTVESLVKKLHAHTLSKFNTSSHELV